MRFVGGARCARGAAWWFVTFVFSASWVMGCGPATKAPATPPSAQGTRIAVPDGVATPPNEERPAGPWALVAERRPIRLRTLKAHVVLVGPLAFTELELSFEALPANAPSARLYFELPEGAALHRFAIDQAGTWHDAELAPDLPGTAPPPTTTASGFESGLAYGVELANLRTPPHLLVSYAEPLPLAGYRLPLRGLPKLDELEVTVEPPLRKSAKHPGAFRLLDETPDADFTLGVADLGDVPHVAALRAGKYAVARIVPTGAPSPELTFLVDSSRSVSTPLARVADALAAVTVELAAMPSPPLVSVVAFDQDIHPIVVRARPPLDARALAPLRDLERLGGTDVEYAISALIAAGLPERQVVLVSDFLQSVVPTGNAFNIRESSLARLDALALDSKAEALFRGQIASGAASDYPGTILRLDASAKEIAKALREPTPEPLKVEVAGTAWVSTRSRSRDSRERAEIGRGLWVFAEYTSDAPLALSIDGKPEPKLAASHDPVLATLLASVVGRAEFAEFGAGAFGSDAEARAAVLKLSSENHFLPPGGAFRVTTQASSGPTLRATGTGLALSTPNRSAVSGEAQVLGRELIPRPAPQVADANVFELASRKPNAGEACPKLVGFSDFPSSDDVCPPVALSFSGAKQSLFADVSFTPAGAVQAERSPHLGVLAELLKTHGELELVGVRTAARAQGEAVIRELERRGVEKGRLVLDRPLDASLPARKPTPRCPTAGERVVFELKKMGLSALYRKLAPHAPAAVPSAPRGRFESIHALLRYDEAGRHGPGALENAASESRRWISEDRDNPLAYVALGDALQTQRDHLGAARAFGSLFDFELPGAGLVNAAAVRLELNAGATPEARRHRGYAAREERIRDIAVATFHRQWQDHPERAEGARGYAYAKYRESDYQNAFGFLYEAAKYSAVAERIELPVFAHLYLASERQEGLLEGLLARDCSFPLQAAVHGVILSWEDPDAELEVGVISEPKHFEYESVLSDQGGQSRAKWLPLPDDDDAYPIHVTVRAPKLGPRGYAFGVLRVINYNGRGRMTFDEKPFVATGAAVPDIYSERIRQVPQGGAL